MEATDLNWRTWHKHGNQYFKSATSSNSNSRLGPEIRYNLLSMALESYVMAILDYHHTLPDNHTYSDLIYGLERVIPLDGTLKERILKYENIQSICSIEKYHLRPPTEEELIDLQGAISEISELTDKICVE